MSGKAPLAVGGYFLFVMTVYTMTMSFESSDFEDARD